MAIRPRRWFHQSVRLREPDAADPSHQPPQWPPPASQSAATSSRKGVMRTGLSSRSRFISPITGGIACLCGGRNIGRAFNAQSACPIPPPPAHKPQPTQHYQTGFPATSWLSTISLPRSLCDYLFNHALHPLQICGEPAHLRDSLFTRIAIWRISQDKSNNGRLNILLTDILQVNN